jgi:hypothetical protein
MITMLLNGEATFVGLLSSCETLLSMEMENGRMVIEYVDFGEVHWEICNKDLMQYC